MTFITARRAAQAFFLVAAIALAFGSLSGAEFITFDDYEYVLENGHVASGLTLEGILWALKSDTYAANWHPLTWISHMIDVQCFGLNPAAHHMVNVAFHASNSVVLFLLVVAMTGAPWRSLLVAALFALHPLHVESVAWVAERKDVLSTFFLFLAIASYGWYVRRPRASRYTMLLVAFALGLMAKPMVVTLPILLLILDFWPLGRLPGVAGSRGQSPPSDRRPSLLRVALEKVPLLALSVLTAALTLSVQGGYGAVKPLPLHLRFSNAVLSYGTYLRQAFWPEGLAIFYPHRLLNVAVREALLVGIGLLLVSALVVWLARRRPYLLSGWLWYLAALLPVAGIVQAGDQGHADRYTYVPLVGIFLLLVWGGSSLGRGRLQTKALGSLAAAALVLLGVITFRQVGTWRDSVRLFQHAIAVTEDNWLAHNNLGIALEERGFRDEAIAQFREAIRIQPFHEGAHFNLGKSLRLAGEAQESLIEYQAAIYIDRGGTALRNRSFDAAARDYRLAMLGLPDRPHAHVVLGTMFEAAGAWQHALAEYREAVRLNPGDATASERIGKLEGNLTRPSMPKNL